MTNSFYRNVTPLRDATRRLLSEINEFLEDLHSRHPAQAVEHRNDLMNCQKLLVWLEDAMGVLCKALNEIGDRPALERFHTSMCEGVDSVLLALIDAIEADDEISWDVAT